MRKYKCFCVSFFLEILFVSSDSRSSLRHVFSLNRSNVWYKWINWQIVIRTVGGERFIAEPRRSCGPMLLWRRMGRPPLGVPPGELAHEDAIRIFGVINVLSDRRRFGNALATRKKLLSGDDGEPKNQPPRTPEPEPTIKRWLNTRCIVELDIHEQAGITRSMLQKQKSRTRKVFAKHVNLYSSILIHM